MRNSSTAYSAVNSKGNNRAGGVGGGIAWSSFLSRHHRSIIATGAFLIFVVFISSDSVQDRVANKGKASFSSYLRGSQRTYYFGGAIHPGYFAVEDSIIDDHTFHFAAVTDLDQLSLTKGDASSKSYKPEFYSLLLPGTLSRDASTGRYSISLDTPRKLLSKHNEAGRGMELSELTIYNNRLLSFDDRTGTVFELLNRKHGQETFAVPRLVVTEGDGNTDKGMKWEWATVKDGELYLGSMGKEYTNKDGSIANTNNMWIAIINEYGMVYRQNWVDQFNFVRAALGASSPGYFINEAILWSFHLQKWVFLPRRISSEAYNENEDERKGSNKLVLVDEQFTQAKVVTIHMKDMDPLHGFSTFAFVPGTKDQHALAIRSVEEDCVGGDESLCKQRTYFIVFDVLTGEVLMDEYALTDAVKYEGVEFVNIFTKEPNYDGNDDGGSEPIKKKRKAQ